MSELVRANKVVVNGIDGGFEAKFFKTHKMVSTITSTDVGFTAPKGVNITAARELFRVHITSTASQYGIEWAPEDRRELENVRSPKYVSDEVLKVDAVKMISPDIVGFIADSGVDGLELVDIAAESITPTTTSAKGKVLSDIGILGGKYSNGNWAWATVELTVTMKFQDREIYLLLEMGLISGQLKKPSTIDKLGFHLTGFKGFINEEIKDLLPTQEVVDPMVEIMNEIEEIAEEVGITVEEVVVKKSRKSRKVGK